MCYVIIIFTFLREKQAQHKKHCLKSLPELHFSNTCFILVVQLLLPSLRELMNHSSNIWSLEKVTWNSEPGEIPPAVHELLQELWPYTVTNTTPKIIAALKLKHINMFSMIQIQFLQLHRLYLQAAGLLLHSCKKLSIYIYKSTE